MSADAKVWQDGDWWTGIHDGEDCPYDHRDISLRQVLEGIEKCMGSSEMRWTIRQYRLTGEVGLVGYC